MKRINLYHFIIALFTLAGISACSDDKGTPIANEGGVKILTFTAGGTVETIDGAGKDGVITLFFPHGSDLTQLQPQYTLSPGAEIILPDNPQGPIDLSVLTTYRVVNGNLYHDYKVIASHISASFSSFAIGKYNGSIDHNARTITVKYPKSWDVSALTPTFSITDDATVSPALGTTVDFTNPVTYTLEYLGEKFVYTVTVEKSDIQPVAFLGGAATGEQLSDADNKAAYTWMSGNFADFEYISFDDIKNGKDLTAYGVIWFHHDSDDGNLPSGATDTAVTNALKAYRAQGGGLFLSSAGVKLGSSLDIAKDNRMYNNDWGWGNQPSVLGENWGMNFSGNETHPIFNGLEMPLGEARRFYIMSQGVKVKGHNAIWNFDSWTGYDFDVAKWENENGGKQLASFYWDDAMNQRAIITEYERNGSYGAVITIAVESYDWYNEPDSPANAYRKNLERLTANVLNYLLKK
ncbi:MAG: DUF4960 domain-containing protein [Capnocytophaga sp.]|nr:DUF4960 domain-containing protein [Capnocytophaga sp.]